MDIAPTYPFYNQGYNPLTKWDEPPSKAPNVQIHSLFQGPAAPSQQASSPLLSLRT